MVAPRQPRRFPLKTAKSTTTRPRHTFVAASLILLTSACAHVAHDARGDFVGTWEGTSSMLFVVEDPARQSANSHELFAESLMITPSHDSAREELVLGLDEECVIAGVIDADGELEFSPQACTTEDAHLSSEMHVWGEASLDGEDEIEILLDGTIVYIDADAAQEVSARLRYHFRGSRR